MFTTTFQKSWVVDSGSTAHIARKYSSFTNNRTIPKGTRHVYLGTNAKADILGIGNYTIELPNGGKLVLENALYAPNMRRNLISVSKLEVVGYKVLFGDGERTSYARMSPRGGG